MMQLMRAYPVCRTVWRGAVVFVQSHRRSCGEGFAGVAERNPMACLAKRGESQQGSWQTACICGARRGWRAATVLCKESCWKN